MKTKHEGVKIAVFDCAMGIAGDMTIGAFIDAGMSFDILKKEIAKLKLKDYSLGVKQVRCGAFRATKFVVDIHDHGHDHHHEHGHGEHHHHVSLKEIEKKIGTSKLHAAIKKRAITIFRNLGRAEARVHGTGIQNIHFHEVGAMDSFIDIVGVAICMHHLGIEKAYVRSLADGRGTQHGDHGEMPVPVPGAYELLKGFWLTQTDHDKEMITPTGAAILATTCERTLRIPRMKLESIGYGAGDREYAGKRGFLRISLGSA